MTQGTADLPAEKSGRTPADTERRFNMSPATGNLTRRQLLRQLSLITGGCFLGLLGASRGFAAAARLPGLYRPPRIALIIDDIGYNRSLARHFVQLNETLTFSVLPQLAYSRALAQELHQQGYEVMLHQPMEPYDNCCDPGPGALFVGDNSKQIKKVLQANIGDIPFAKGVNNHMGSKFTSARHEIAEALKVIQSRKLFFVDSITSSRSLAHATAKRYQMPTAHRNVFLDNDREETAILRQLARLKKHAIMHGRAIGIGHPYPETARAIGRFSRQLKRSNVSLVSVSEILFG